MNRNTPYQANSRTHAGNNGYELLRTSSKLMIHENSNYFRNSRTATSRWSHHLHVHCRDTCNVLLTDASEQSSRINEQARPINVLWGSGEVQPEVRNINSRFSVLTISHLHEYAYFWTDIHVRHLFYTSLKISLYLFCIFILYLFYPCKYRKRGRKWERQWLLGRLTGLYKIGPIPRNHKCCTQLVGEYLDNKAYK